MKRSRIFFYILLIVLLNISFGIGKVVQQQSNQEQKAEGELIKKGEAPHLTIFYFGELQGFIAPCG